MNFSMKKNLNEDAIYNELHGNSLFFPSKSVVEKKDRKPSPALDTPSPSQESKQTLPREVSVPAHDITTPRYHDTVIPRHHETIIETTRRAVKQLGKEAATHRFTVEEKKALKTIEREYEEKDIRTSENEITRISINYVIEDYHANGRDSILARVLKLLNS
jgi:hypothetical protein